MTRTARTLAIFIVGFLVTLPFAQAAWAAASGPDVSDASTAWAAIEHYGAGWGTALVAFAVLSWFVKRNGEEHWLAQDHLVPAISGFTGVLGAIVDWHFNGGPPTAIAVALMGAIMLVLQKPKPGPVAPALEPQPIKRDSQNGAVAEGVVIGISLLTIGLAVFVGVALVLVAGCGPVRKAGDAAKQAAIDCAKVDAVSHVPDVMKILSDGGPDWKKQMEDLLITAGEDEVACTVRAVVAVLSESSDKATADHNAIGSTPEVRALINGRSLINERGWSFAGGPTSMREVETGRRVRVERKRDLDWRIAAAGWGL